ncbi:hypothetical protein V5F34_08750 [Xanthobacter autotrophicus]|uniref:hypothetical protein n=1 Tax=Xanthobacter autotrophicus TaxID=280 RepID=UPI00372A30F2
MPDLPILFSPPMIRSLVREIEQPGTGKTQTRRTNGVPTIERTPSGGWLVSNRAGGIFTWSDSCVSDIAAEMLRYQRGDRLYVREHWRASYSEDDHAPRDIPAGSVVEYLATDEGELNGKDRRGMHMPRWASRLTLYITDVRVERLQDISEEDARAEGAYVAKASRRVADNYETMAITGIWFPTARAWYADLWGRINGRGAWDANPWVAAYTFVPRAGNIDSLPATIEVAA